MVALLTALMRTLCAEEKDKHCQDPYAHSVWEAETTYVLGVSDICHFDVGVKVLLQDLLESLRVEAEPDFRFGKDPVLHHEVELEYLTKGLLA